MADDKLKDLSEQEKYKSLIDKYEAMQDAPAKEPDWTAALPDMLAGAHNIINYAQGTPQQNLKLGSMDAAKKAAAANKKSKEEGNQNLQNMYQKYMAIQEAENAKKQAKIYKDREFGLKEGIQKSALEEKQKDRDLKEKLAKLAKLTKDSIKKLSKTKLEETREKNIANRFDSLQEQIPNRRANIEEAKFLSKAIKNDELGTGPFSETAGNVGSLFSTKESTLKQRLDSLAEKAARAQLKANGEVKPTDADVEGMKKAMFNLGNTEEANVKKLADFVKQQEAGINEYEQMKGVLDSGKGLENFLLKETYKPDATISKKVRVQTPDGRVGTVSREKLEKFMKAHPTAKIME